MNEHGRGHTPHSLEQSSTTLSRRRRRTAAEAPTIFHTPSSRRTATCKDRSGASPVHAATTPNGSRRSAAAPPPHTPQQGRSEPHHDGNEAGGQKLHSQVITSAATTSPRAPKLARSTDLREHTADRSPAQPPRASPEWGRSGSTLIPHRHRRHHPDGTARKTYPTMYTPEAQERVSATLPPPRRRTEREGEPGLAGGGTRDKIRLPFAC